MSIKEEEYETILKNLTLELLRIVEELEELKLKRQEKAEEMFIESLVEIEVDDDIALFCQNPKNWKLIRQLMKDEKQG